MKLSSKLSLSKTFDSFLSTWWNSFFEFFAKLNLEMSVYVTAIIILPHQSTYKLKVSLNKVRISRECKCKKLMNNRFSSPVYFHCCVREKWGWQLKVRPSIHWVEHKIYCQASVIRPETKYAHDVLGRWINSICMNNMLFSVRHLDMCVLCVTEGLFIKCASTILHLGGALTTC